MIAFHWVFFYEISKMFKKCSKIFGTKKANQLIFNRLAF